MEREKKQSFEFYYDEVGEKEVMEQITDAYQSGYDYTITQENDPQQGDTL